MNTTAIISAQIGFGLMSVIYPLLFLREVTSALKLTPLEESRRKLFKRNWFLGLIAWVTFVSFWSLSGQMADFSNFPFNFLPVVGIPLITVLFLTFSASMNEVLRYIPKQNLIRLQSFRFFVEIMLWLLFSGNSIPVQMTFEGLNFDILAGISAPVISWLLMRGSISRTALIAWNIVCLMLLINIVTIAILSTPSPLRVFMNEPANTAVVHFPVSLLPGLLVPLAYMLHFYSLRQLVSMKENVIAEIHS